MIGNNKQAQRQEYKQMPQEVTSVHVAERLARERQIKDALSIHTLPIERTANPRVQEVVGQHDNLPNLRKNHGTIHKIWQGTFTNFLMVITKCSP